ncbi:MAG: hypothetical protein VB099_14810 [Candidatus Limiplasma sp.]|nr:hypothetical protein [Candidatus Limiplasma sp.]
MSIEVALLISVVSVSTAVFFGLRNAKRAEKCDNQQEAAAMTTVIVKLENIGEGVTEIKGEMRSMRDDQQQTRERLVKVEESAKQAHKRLDALCAARTTEE